MVTTQGLAPCSPATVHGGVLLHRRRSEKGGGAWGGKIKNHAPYNNVISVK